MEITFLKRFGLFIVLGLFLMGGASYILITRVNVPPIITESIGFDVKLENLRDKGLTQIDLLAHGSSVSYNNLHSSTLSSHLDSSISFYNTASGGLNMSQNYRFLKLLNEIYHPQVVLLVSCHVDFGKAKFSLGEEQTIENYLSLPTTIPFYLRKFDLMRLLDRSKLLNSYYRDEPTATSTLAYDEMGGISLSVPEENRDPYLWNRPLVADVEESQYHALEDICNYFQEFNIPLIYVQHPMKTSNCYSSACKNFQQEHISRVKSIVTSFDHQFINLYSNNPYPDSLFADDIHLNFEGPEKFTLELLDKINLNKMVIKAKYDYSELSGLP